MATSELATLSLDLDNKWSYLKTHGDKQWESYPTYLDIVIPRVLPFLKERNLQITFFVVGQDAALEINQPFIKMIADAGHEISNHSFYHEPWLHLYSEDQIEAEIARAEKQIEAVTGQRPIGFRGPGYSLSQSVLRVLKRRGYCYDCSTFPTYLGPLARAYYFMTARLSPEEKQQRKKLFGTFREGLRPNKAYRWQMDGELSLIEIPVTTMPIFKIPIHVSYVLYLSVFSRTLALLYFRIALLMCRLTGTQPSLLLHPLDFLGGDDTHDLDFFPAMRLSHEKKLSIVSEILRMLGQHYQLVPIKVFADHALQARQLSIMQPHFEAKGSKKNNFRVE